VGEKLKVKNKQDIYSKIGKTFKTLAE